MKGTLTIQPLAELIREIAVKGLSGTLRLERDRAQIAVYFERGLLLYAASNVKTLRLRDHLIRRNLLSESRADTLPRNLPDLELASKLVNDRIVRQREMDAVLSVLVSDILRVALLWTDGAWEFDIRSRLAASTRTQVDVATLLREAAQRLSFTFVAQRLRNASEILTRVSEVSGSSNLQNAESFILSRLDKPMSLQDLITLSGLPEAEARRFIYGLALSGLLEREYWQNAFRTDVTKTRKDQLPVFPKPVNTAGGGEQSVNWVTANVENEELDQFLRRLRHATNHYEVIELPPSADANEIKESYYAMARRYHPDRFHLKSGTKLHSDISSAFARVTQAYETLTNANARQAYDETLQRSGAFARKAEEVRKATDDDSETPDGPDAEYGRAEYNIREGHAALQQGRLDNAINFLSVAVRLDPQQARYRAHYGRALAGNDSTRRVAESELQAAIKLEPRNVNFRTMLAEFYFDLNFHRRAQSELDRALALDPKNATAHALLRKLERARKVG
jgi:curved DNA-binding protein CbpA